jgi:beta-glucanase (GH16 family)
LSTATKFGFVYGEMSAWIKVPAADGYWPAFWSLNSEPDCCATKTLPVGELDVMEQYTTWDTLYHRAFHNWNGSQTWHGGDAVCGNVNLTTAYHRYTARVEPGQVTFFFDGQQCGRTISKTIGAGAPYAFGPDLLDPNFLILSVAVGGASGQQNPATQPAIMLVDRVEVRGL